MILKYHIKNEQNEFVTNLRNRMMKYLSILFASIVLYSCLDFDAVFTHKSVENNPSWQLAAQAPEV
jgi:hypothetical protein